MRGRTQSRHQPTSAALEETSQCTSPLSAPALWLQFSSLDRRSEYCPAENGEQHEHERIPAATGADIDRIAPAPHAKHRPQDHQEPEQNLQSHFESLLISAYSFTTKVSSAITCALSFWDRACATISASMGVRSAQRAHPLSNSQAHLSPINNLHQRPVVA